MAQGAWVRYGTQANAPVQVVGGNLTFAGYQDSSVGMAVALGGSNSSDQDLQVPFSTDPVTSGAIYVSALVKFSSVTDDVFFLTYAGKNFSGFGDGKSNVNNARLFACKGSADGKFKLGLSKNAATPADRTSAEYDLGHHLSRGDEVRVYRRQQQRRALALGQSGQCRAGTRGYPVYYHRQ